MNNTPSTTQLLFALLFATLISCKESPTKNIQGVFIADKESLKSAAAGKMGNSNALASALLKKIVDNAVVEFKIKDDSIKGVMFLAGITNTIHAKIESKNDSLFVKTDNSSFLIIPNNEGFLLNEIQMIKSNQDDLSPKTKTALEDHLKKQAELKDFKDNLGQWRKGYYVDELGDKTGKGYPFIVLAGSHENSTVVNSDVYVKGFMSNDKLFFEIYNSTFSFKENLPESEFGVIKIKFPNGEIKTEKVFFFQNTLSESPDDKKPVIYNHLVSSSDGELKILIDLGISSSYRTDKYQFSIKRGNLDEVLASIRQQK